MVERLVYTEAAESSNPSPPKRGKLEKRSVNPRSFEKNVRGSIRKKKKIEESTQQLNGRKSRKHVTEKKGRKKRRKLEIEKTCLGSSGGRVPG